MQSVISQKFNNNLYMLKIKIKKEEEYFYYTFAFL